jgi:hypothetical protein
MDLNLIFEPDEMLFFAGRAAILVTAFLAFAFAFGRWRRAAARDMQRLLSELEQARSDSRALAAVAERLVVRLGGLEDKIDTRAQLAAAADSHPRGYELALRLARNGATIEQISETSGVTRQEAQLLARLHGPRRTA